MTPTGSELNFISDYSVAVCARPPTQASAKSDVRAKRARPKRSSPDFQPLPGSLSEFVRDEYLKRRFLSKSGLECYVSVARQLDSWLAEKGLSVELEGVELDSLFAFIKAGMERGQATATADKYARALRVLFRVAAKAGRSSIAAEDIRGPKRTKKNPRAWSYKEWKALLKACLKLKGRIGPWRTSAWFRALLLVCYDSGQRISTVMSLRVVDVNLDEAIAIFNSTKESEENVAFLQKRTVEALKAIWDPKRTEVFGEWQFDRGDRQWAALNRLLEKAIKLAEIRDIGRFHAIRKTAATLVAQRHGIAAATEFLSHSTSRVTVQHYIDRTAIRRRALPPE